MVFNNGIKNDTDIGKDIAMNEANKNVISN